MKNAKKKQAVATKWKLKKLNLIQPEILAGARTQFSKLEQLSKTANHLRLEPLPLELSKSQQVTNF